MGARDQGSKRSASVRKAKVTKRIEEEEKETRRWKRSGLRFGSGMALMLRHISGKRDFDLFATPFTKHRLFSQEDLKCILQQFTANRLSSPVQKRLSEQDSPMH